jgi:CheY-like chemotaxis protein
MNQGESGYRRCAMQPTQTVLHERRSAEAPLIVDVGSPAGSEPAPTVPQAIAALPGAIRGLRRVLVVDDDEVIRQLIAANLTLAGFDVATAMDGQDCLDKVSVIAPDVITLDVMMPRLDGWETAIRLRKRPDTSHIKVVLITAGVQEGDQAQHRHACADAYLTKPFDPAEMIRVIRELAGVPPAALGCW